MIPTLEYDLLYSQMGYSANEHIIFSIWLRFVRPREIISSILKNNISRVRFIVHNVFSKQSYRLFSYQGAYLSPAVSFFVTGASTCYISWHSSLFIFGKIRN